MSDPTSDLVPEPTGMTLGDLVALVAGAALAASLTWYSQWERYRTLAGRPAPEWYIILLYAREVLRKGCIALVPVILARKVRHRGPIRPGEFAALCVGADLLMLEVHSWPALGIQVPVPGMKDTYLSDPTRTWAWRGVILAASALAAVLLAARRRQLPRAAGGLLLVAVWYGLAKPFQHVILNLAMRFSPGLSPVGMVLFYAVTCGLPSGIIALTPAAFAALDAPRRRPGRTWVEGAGLALALGSWLSVNGQTFLRQRFGDLGPRSTGFDAIHTATPLLTILLALALARLLDRPLRRWLGLA